MSTINQIIFRIRVFGIHLMRSVSRYRIHSPFVYRVVIYGLRARLGRWERVCLRQLRKDIRRSSTFSSVDAGTGVSRNLSGSQLVHMGISGRYGRMLYGISKHLRPDHILEIGTSAGLSAAYMSLGHPGATVTTIEACGEKARLARELLDKNGFSRVSVVHGYGKEVLDRLIEERYRAQMVFVDADHSLEGTLDFFHRLISLTGPGSVIVFDDIYWSAGMHRAWREIIRRRQVTLSLATFRLGLVFFHPRPEKQNFLLRL